MQVGTVVAVNVFLNFPRPLNHEGVFVIAFVVTDTGGTAKLCCGVDPVQMRAIRCWRTGPLYVVLRERGCIVSLFTADRQAFMFFLLPLAHETSHLLPMDYGWHVALLPFHPRKTTHRRQTKPSSKP